MSGGLEILDDMPPPPSARKSREESRKAIAGRELPNNLQAEAGLLSSMLVDVEVFVRSREAGLYAEAFYSPAHRIVYEAILELHDHGELPDTISLCEVLRTRGDLEAVGGVAFIESLANYIETTAHAGHFRKIVQDKYALRQAIRRATGFVEKAYEFNTSSGDLPELLESIGAGDLNGRSMDFPGRKPSSFIIPPDNAASNLLGTNRYVCRGDGGLLVSNSGVGKSSIAFQAAYHWCLGRPMVGIPTLRPQRIMIVQSEDADGDIGECRESCERMMKLTDAEKALIDQRLCIIRDKTNRGDGFIRALGDYVRRWPPDIVILNPLHAFAGCDISDAEELGRFLREGLNRVNREDKFAYWIIHHTPKPSAKVEDRAKRQWNEVMYEAAGSAELVNWARFIMTLKARAEPGKFDLVLAKRGKRAGVAMEVVTEYGRRVEYGVTTIPVRHCEETFTLPGNEHPIHTIYWLPLEEVQAAPAEEEKKDNRGPKDHWDREKIIKYFPLGEANALPLPQINKNAVENFGVPKSTLSRIRNELLDANRIMQRPDGCWFRI